MYERAPKPYEKALKPEHTSTLLTVNDLGNPTETTIGLEPSLPSKVARCTIIRCRDGDIAAFRASYVRGSPGRLLSMRARLARSVIVIYRE